MRLVVRRGLGSLSIATRLQSAFILSSQSKAQRPRAQYSTAPPREEGKSDGALKGVKILDLSRVLAGPLCTQILADYGADVIKVEDLGRGDDTRYFKVAGEESTWKENIGPMSNYFASINRNKRSITLDLKHEHGREIFLRLAEKSDVVIENFRTGTAEKLGIGYETLAKINPLLIYASITGYGSSGPYAQRAGYDMIAGAEAGLLHLTGERGRPPVRPGLGVTDMSTGLYTHGAIMAALYARTRTGRGQKIEASLFETQISLLTNVAAAWLNVGQETERWGTQHPSVVPYDAFKTKDLYFVCGATNDKQFATLCRLLGNEALAREARFKTNSDRVRNREELFPILNELFAQKSTDEWTVAFEGSGMPYGAINTMEKVFSHPQTEARGMVQNVSFDSAKSGSLSLLRPAVTFSDTKTSLREMPPRHGEHTKEVLKEIGFTANEISNFVEQKVV